MASPAREARLAAQARGFTEVAERGRGYLKTRNPINGAGCLDTQVGAKWHYGVALDQEIDTAWTVDVGAWQWKMDVNDFQVHARNVFNVGNIFEFSKNNEWVIFDPQSINWINEVNSRQQIAIKQAVSAHFHPEFDNELHFGSAYGPGKHFSYINHTSRIQKLITIDAPTDLPAPIIPGTIWFEAEFSLSTSPNIDIYLDGVRWTKPNGVRVRTVNRIEFRSISSGETLWWLDYPRAFDSDQNETIGQMEVRRQGGPSALFITVRIPKLWIDQAVFPLYVDPTIDETVGASADDAEESSVGACDIDNATFRLNANNEWLGARFQTIALDGTENISANTYVQLFWSNATRDIANHYCYMEDVDDAAAFTTDANNISGRSRTSSVSWINPDVTGGTIGYYPSPSLEAQVQAVIDRAGWATGQDMAFLMTLIPSSGGDAQISFYDGGASYAPKLHIEYETGGITYTGTFSMAKTLNFTDLGVLTAVGNAGLGEALGLGNTGQLSGTNQLDITKYLGLQSTSQYIGTVSLELGKLLNLANSGLLTVPTNVSLDRNLGLTDLSQLTGVGSVGLANALSWEDATQLSGTSQLSLTKYLGASEATQLAGVNSLALGTSLGLTMSLGALVLGSISLDKGLTFSANSQLDAIGSIGLGELLDLGNSGLLSGTTNLSLGKALGLSTTSSAIFVGTVGFGLDLDFNLFLGNIVLANMSLGKELAMTSSSQLDAVGTITLTRVITLADGSTQVANVTADLGKVLAVTLNANGTYNVTFGLSHTLLLALTSLVTPLVPVTVGEGSLDISDVLYYTLTIWDEATPDDY